jgi:glycogen(starch) synthase
MNILLTSLQVPGAASGVRVHYERLATVLRVQGHEVTLVTQDSLRPWVRSTIGIGRRALALLPGRLGERIGLELGNIVEIFCAIDRHKDYDLVNAQDISSGWAAHLALRGRVPVVVTGHFNGDPAEEVIQQQQLTGMAALFMRSWYGMLLRRTQYFLGVSQSVLRYSATLLPPDTLRTVVYNGIDFQHFAQPQPSSGLRLRFPGQHIILNIGHLEARKNQHYLLSVAQALRAYRQDFVIGLIGQGPDETSLRDRIAAENLTAHVVLLGYQAPVAPLLQEADLYLHTALSESFGLVLIEAIAAGVPALAFALDGTSEVLAATPVALRDATDPPEILAHYLNGLLADSGARKQLHTQQYDYAATRFTSAELAANTLAFFEQVRQHAVNGTIPVPPIQATHATMPPQEVVDSHS